MLLTGSRDELCGLLPALFQAWLITCPLLILLPFQPVFTESSCGDQLLSLSPFSSALSATLPLCYMLVFSSLCLLFRFFFFAGVFVCPGGYAGLSLGWLGEYCMMLGAHQLVCQLSPK
jgi:preprotein translocase subunit SecY